MSLLGSSGDHQGVSSASDPDITIVGGTTLGIGAQNPAYHDILPLSRSDPQIDRAFSTRGLVEIKHKFLSGFLVGVNDAQDPHGTQQVTPSAA